MRYPIRMMERDDLERAFHGSRNRNFEAFSSGAGKRAYLAIRLLRALAREIRRAGVSWHAEQSADATIVRVIVRSLSMERTTHLSAAEFEFLRDRLLQPG